MIQLRDYQQECLDSIEAAGDGRWLCQLATGMGKTVIFSRIPLRGRELILSHRQELVHQPLKYFDCPTAIEMSNEKAHDSFAPVVSASVQTMTRRMTAYDPATFDTIIVDECFPAGTLVDDRPIESIKEGDFVYSYNFQTKKIEKKKVVHCFKIKRHNNLYRFSLSDLRQIVVTENHPIFLSNEGDFVNAKRIRPQDWFVCVRPMRNAYSGDAEVSFDALREVLLQCDMFEEFLQKDFIAYYGENKQKVRLRKNEAKESYDGFKRSTEDARNATPNWASSDCTRWERKRADEGTRVYFQPGEKMFLDSIFGVRDSDETEEEWFSCMLQSGHCCVVFPEKWWRGNDGSYRVGRELSSWKAKGMGRQKGCILDAVRVESVEIVEPRSNGDDEYVYNIEVEGNNNYFANGILVHNCHHCASESYRKILDYFKPRRVLGFTATPNRADGVGLECCFDKIIYQKDLKWGIEHKYLSNIVCKRLNIGYNLAGVARRMGDYAVSDLERVLNVDRCNDAIAEAVANICEPPVLIFAVDVKHAHDIATAINKKLWNPRYPNGYARALSANSEDRAEVVKRYMDGQLPVLVNCSLFTEGTDLPNTRTVMIARPTTSTTLYTQMVGRGTRLAPGKDHCLLIDCVGVSNNPICTAPSLLGLDPQDVPKKYRHQIEGDLLADIPNLIAQKTDTPESWIQNIKIVDLWAKENEYVLHDVNWQKRPDGSLFLSLPNGQGGKCNLFCTAPDALGEVSFITAGVTRRAPAQQAYDIAYEVLRSQFAESAALWRASSVKRWGSAPATEKQLEYMQKLAEKRKVDVSDMHDLTKMQVSCLIEHLRDYKSTQYKKRDEVKHAKFLYFRPNFA